MTNTEEAQKKAICPVCDTAYAAIPSFCGNCGWEFIFTNQSTPAFKQYIQLKLEHHKGLFERSQICEEKLSKLEKTHQGKLQIIKTQSQEIEDLQNEITVHKKGLKTLRAKNTKLTNHLNGTLAKLEDVELRLVEEKASKSGHPRKNQGKDRVQIDYSINGRTSIKITFNKAGIGLPSLMHFYFAKADPKRREFFISKAEMSLFIRSSKLVPVKGGYNFYFPQFMETLEGPFEGFLHLPFSGKFEINPKIRTLIF